MELLTQRNWWKLLGNGQIMATFSYGLQCSSSQQIVNTKYATIKEGDVVTQQTVGESQMPWVGAHLAYCSSMSQEQVAEDPCAACQVEVGKFQGEWCQEKQAENVVQPKSAARD